MKVTVFLRNEHELVKELLNKFKKPSLMLQPPKQRLTLNKKSMTAAKNCSIRARCLGAILMLRKLRWRKRAANSKSPSVSLRT